MLDLDRQDEWVSKVLGTNLMTGTIRLFGLLALIAIVGGGSFWLLSR
jgi:hypothetical protein